MIVDSHAHAFPYMGSASGHRSAREHLKYVQHIMMSHHQPQRRVLDNAVAPSNTLWDGRDAALGAMHHVAFRAGDYGRFTWVSNDDEHYIQYFPPSLRDIVATPEQMVAQMDYLGVSKAVLQTGHLYGKLNTYIARAVQKYPHRFWGLAMVDEWKADHPSERRTVDHAVKELGLHALWFYSVALRQHRRAEALDDPAFFPFWRHVRKLGIPVFWSVSTSFPGADAYMAEMDAFGRWAHRYQDIPVVYTHGLPLGRFTKDGKISVPKEAWRALESKNVLLELLIPIAQGASWEYPFVEARPFIKEAYERLGPDRLVWGSDMPNVERHCTYRQSLDYLRLHCDFIPKADMEKITGKNTAKLFGAS